MDHYESCLVQGSQRFDVSIRCDDVGKVTATVKELSETTSTTTVPKSFVEVETTAEKCSWNVYAAKKAKLAKSSSAPSFIDTNSEGRILRLGSQIILPKPKIGSVAPSFFTPRNMSLSLDHVQQHDRFLFVTSRRKVMTMPEVEDESSNQVVKDAVVEQKDSDKTASPSEAQIMENSKDDTLGGTPEKKISDSDSDSETDDSDDKSDTSIGDEELSAYESWSEASTDLEDAGVHQIADLPQEPVSKTPTTKDETAQAETTSSSDSSDSEESPDVCSGYEPSSDDESVKGNNTRYAVSSDEEEVCTMIDTVLDDRDNPGNNSESNDDDEGEKAWDDTGYAVFGQDDDFDGFQAVESDSDCSACGDDDGICAFPLQDDTKTAEIEEEEVAPLGTPMAQVHVYDTSFSSRSRDGNIEMKPLFRFQHPTTQVLLNSPLAVHPSKSLLIWPLGDGRLLFADYKHNTYFLKRLRVSRFWSQHATVSCRFSANGEHMHIAALERWSGPPRKPVKLKKSRDVVPKAKPKQLEESARYDLVLSTYRVSTRKTARAPPVLIHQIKQHLGQIEQSHALPTYSWTERQVYVTHNPLGNQLKVYRIDLFRDPRLSFKERTAEATLLELKKPAVICDEHSGHIFHYFLNEADAEGSGVVCGIRPMFLTPWTKEAANKEKVDTRDKEEAISII